MDSYEYKNPKFSEDTIKKACEIVDKFISDYNKTLPFGSTTVKLDITDFTKLNITCQLFYVACKKKNLEVDLNVEKKTILLTIKKEA